MQNLLWLAADRLLRMGVNVLVLGLVARHLGPEQFGVMNYAVGLAGIFAPVATLGMDGIVIRELVTTPAQSATTLGTAFVLRLAGDRSSRFGGGGGVVDAGRGDGRAAGVGGSAGVSAAVVRCDRPVVSAAGAVEVYGHRAGGGAAVGGRVEDRAGVALAGAGAGVLRRVGGGCVVGRGGVGSDVSGAGERIFDWRVSWSAAENLLRQSWPLILSGLLVAGYLRVEQLLVMERLGSRSAGIYYAAVRITEIWLFVPGLILSSFYPLLLEKRVHDRAEYEVWLQRLFDALTGLGYVVALGAGLLAPWLIRLLYGAEYEPAAVILMILAATAPVIFSGSVRAQYFLLENLNLYHTWSALVGMAMNVGMALALMPRWGASGAAAGALAGYFLSAVGTSLVFPALRQCGSWQVRALLLPFRLAALRRYWKEYREV